MSCGLQNRGFKSPYLRNYVVARINPVRFHKRRGRQEATDTAGLQALTRMAPAAKTFKARIRVQRRPGVGCRRSRV